MVYGAESVVERIGAGRPRVAGTATPIASWNCSSAANAEVSSARAAARDPSPPLLMACTSMGRGQAGCLVGRVELDQLPVVSHEDAGSAPCSPVTAALRLDLMRQTHLRRHYDTWMSHAGRVWSILLRLPSRSRRAGTRKTSDAVCQTHALRRLLPPVHPSSGEDEADSFSARSSNSRG